MTEFVRGTTLTPQQVYRPHFVYSAWDASGTCLYVGCTNNLTRRMREHDKPPLSWVRRTVVMTAMEFPNRLLALDVEARQIGKLRPLYNTAHNPRRMTVGEAQDSEEWSQDFDDLNFDGAAGRARYLERHPDASAQVRRWIALQDARDERLARNAS